MLLEIDAREELLSIISDQYKSVNGFRPSLARYRDMSDAELEKELDYLNVQVEASIEEDKMRENAAAAAFEKRLADFIELGAADEAAAFRWLLDAEGIGGSFAEDPGYVEYCLGLPYNFLKGRFPA